MTTRGSDEPHDEDEDKGDVTNEGGANGEAVWCPCVAISSSTVSMYLVYKIKLISKPIQWAVEGEKNLPGFQ